jgi:hypothetical protein
VIVSRLTTATMPRTTPTMPTPKITKETSGNPIVTLSTKSVMKATTKPSAQAPRRVVGQAPILLPIC